MMNKIFALLAAILLISCGGSDQNADLSITGIMSKLKWGSSYEEIKTVLTGEYGMTFKKEIAQDEGSTATVFEYSGGNLNGYKTDSWIVTFDNDKLLFIVLRLNFGSPQQYTDAYNNLLRHISETTGYDSMKLKGSSRWVLQKNGEVSTIISMNTVGEEKGLVITVTEAISQIKVREKDAPETEE